MLFWSFLIASMGLAAIILVAISFARRPSRPIAAFFCLALFSWLLALNLGVSGFSWQTGAALHLWFRRFSLVAARVAWILVPMAGAALTFPYPSNGANKAGLNLVFALSLCSATVCLAAALAIVPPLTLAMLAGTDEIWIASFAFISFVAIAVVAIDRERVRRDGTMPSLISIASIALAFAGAPLAFRSASLNEDIIVLALSAIVSLSVITLTFLSAWKDSTRRAGKPSNGQAERGSDGLAPPRGPATTEGANRTPAAIGKTLALSARENEIAGLIAEGKTNSEIAETLFISQKTVETHLYNIYRKTGVTNRVQLARALLSIPQ